MKRVEKEGLRRRLEISVVVAMMLLLSMSMMAMGANQLHWGSGDGEDLPTGEDVGVSYFVDYTFGNDNNNGLTWATAKRTIQAAVNVGTGEGDYIYVTVPHHPEDVTVNMPNLHIIGEDKHLTNVRSFNVVEFSVEITGFYIHGSQGGTSIACSGEFPYIHDNTITGPGSGGVGLSLTNPNFCYAEVFSNDFRCYSLGGTAIEISGSATGARIYDNEFSGFTTGIRLNTAGYNNFIYNNRFFGSSPVHAGTSITGIQISSGNYNTISQNWIGYCTTPISDAGISNAWLDNHWDGWEGSFTLTTGHGIAQQTVLSNVDIPSEGKVTVRYWFDPTDSDIQLGAIVTAYMYHPTAPYNTVLLAPVGTWTQGFTNQFFPVVEATLDGGDNQMTMKVSINPQVSGGDGNLVIYYEILDA